MQKFNVTMSDDATDDLFDIVDYLNGFSLAIGEKYFDEIFKKVNSLETLPERCPLVAYTPLCEKDYRWLFVRNYTIFFTIHKAENFVSIRRILYAR